jgi:hypothetical protein
MFQHAQRICVFALASLGLHAQTTTTPPAQETRTTGMVGIAEGQTAQLNALNPEIGSTTAVCSGLLTFLGDDGHVLKAKTVSVAPGTSQAIVLDSQKDLALTTPEHRQIRATLTIPPVPPPSTNAATAVPPVCKLIGTLEIFNTLDGRTLVTLGTVHKVPNPVTTPGS